MEKNDDDQFSKITENLGKKLTLESTSNQFEGGDDDDDDHDVVYVINDDDDDDDEDDDNEAKEFEFSFAGVEVKSPESAENLFQNGRIRPTYPFIVENSEESSSEKAVKKVYVAPPSPTPSTAAMSPEFRRKSNSTGFSRFWRVKELLARSNSDGKDRFVFVPSSSTKDDGVEKEEKKKKKMMKVVNLRRIKVGKKYEDESKSKSTSISTSSGGGGGGGEKKKGKTMSAAYEAFYGKKSGGGGGGEKSSYLPYRVGFFTNASGMTRNLHPY